MSAPGESHGPRIGSVPVTLNDPRAAAVAGILFSVLLIISLVIIRLYMPADPHDAGQWLAGNGGPIELALNLLPFAGIAFLWFIGVLRDHLGEHEDRFFATVFLGSGLLFLAMMFASAALAGGILIAYSVSPTALADSTTYAFAARRHLCDPEHLRDQDGRGVHDFDLHAVRPHQSDATLDGVAGLYPGAAPPGEHQPFELDHPGLSAVDSPDQRAYPDRERPQKARRRIRLWRGGAKFGEVGKCVMTFM